MTDQSESSLDLSRRTLLAAAGISGAAAATSIIGIGDTLAAPASAKRPSADPVATPPSSD